MDTHDIAAVILTAMTPIGELRAGIPLGIARDMTWYATYGWAVLGNMVPVIVLLLVLEPGSRILLSFPNPAGWFIRWRAERIQRRQRDLLDRWGAWALVPFVAIPLPITGAWTGCFVAWALGVPAWRAVIPIFVGVIIAGGIVTALVQLSLNFPFIHD